MLILERANLSYKECMHPKVSKAEIEVFKALSMAGLTSGMVTQKTIVLKSTIPDFCWLNKRKIVYLDGLQAHSSDKQQQHDEEIFDLLTAQGAAINAERVAGDYDNYKAFLKCRRRRNKVKINLLSRNMHQFYNPSHIALNIDLTVAS